MAKAKSILICPDDNIMDVDVIVRSILESNLSTKPAKEFWLYGDVVANSEGATGTSNDGGGSGGSTPECVLMHYKDMRMYQTVEFYGRMAMKYTFNDGKYRCVARGLG
jgi:hypothetical protein